MIWVALTAAKLSDKPRSSLVNKLSLVHKRTRTGLNLRLYPTGLLTVTNACSQYIIDSEGRKCGDRDLAGRQCAQCSCDSRFLVTDTNFASTPWTLLLAVLNPQTAGATHHIKSHKVSELVNLA